MVEEQDRKGKCSLSERNSVLTGRRNLTHLVSPLNRHTPLQLLQRPQAIFPTNSRPRSRITKRATPRALARPPEVFRKGRRRDLFEEVVFVGGTEDVDLGDGGFVEPAFDEGPDGGESPGGVDDVELAHLLVVEVREERGRRLVWGGARRGGEIRTDGFGVVVLRDCRRDRR
jgi:hypothetical protein